MDNYKVGRFFETQCIVINIMLLADVACQKLLKLANISHTYLKLKVAWDTVYYDYY